MDRETIQSLMDKAVVSAIAAEMRERGIITQRETGKLTGSRVHNNATRADTVGRCESRTFTTK